MPDTKEELVQAMAHAICKARTLHCRRLGCCAYYEDYARIAIEAFLAALPGMPSRKHGIVLDTPAGAQIWRCECANERKPCNYHEGFADGWEALLEAMGAA